MYGILVTTFFGTLVTNFFGILVTSGILVTKSKNGILDTEILVTKRNYGHQTEKRILSKTDIKVIKKLFFNFQLINFYVDYLPVNQSSGRVIESDQPGEWSASKVINIEIDELGDEKSFFITLISVLDKILFFRLVTKIPLGDHNFSVQYSVFWLGAKFFDVFWPKKLVTKVPKNRGDQNSGDQNSGPHAGSRKREFTGLW